MARTWKVCNPSLRPVYDFALAQAAKLPASSLHSKLATPLPPVSEPLKLKLAELLLLGLDGVAVMLVSGADASRVKASSWTIAVPPASNKSCHSPASAAASAGHDELNTSGLDGGYVMSKLPLAEASGRSPPLVFAQAVLALGLIQLSLMLFVLAANPSTRTYTVSPALKKLLAVVR